MPAPASRAALDAEPGIEFFAKPALLAHRADGAGVGAAAGESVHRRLVGPDREGHLVQPGDFPMPILNATLGSEPITAEISGSRFQKRRSDRGRIVARVRAASGPSPASASARNGARPDQAPRAEVGVRNTVQSSAARARQRRKIAPSAVSRRAVPASSQTTRIAQTFVFGTGVNPSPVPDPQSFQNRAPGNETRAIRPSAICPSTQNRARTLSNLKKEMLTDWIFATPSCVNQL